MINKKIYFLKVCLFLGMLDCSWHIRAHDRMRHSLFSIDDFNNSVVFFAEQLIDSINTIESALEQLEISLDENDLAFEAEDEYAFVENIYKDAVVVLKNGYIVLSSLQKSTATEAKKMFIRLRHKVKQFEHRLDKLFLSRANVFPGVVHNDALGIASSSLIVNADIDAAAAIVDTKLATISTAGKVANSATTATNLNTANAIVARDATGNFSAGTITANLSGNATTATTATTATNFSGSLSGDVIGTQGATVVSLVGGQTAASVASATTTVNAATNLNTASTLVKRDSTGSFAAQTISVVDEVVSGNISMSDSTSATVGNINKAGTRFIHNFGTNNTFVGKSAGNFSTSGTGGNSGFGVNALASNTTGANNTAVGRNALSTNTIGVSNTAVGDSALLANTTASFNTAIGVNALTANTVGLGNTALGMSALAANTTASNNVAVGVSSLTTNTTGVQNVAVGNNALSLNVIGGNNTAVGHFALSSNTADSNSAVGAFALNSNTTGTGNTAMGRSALFTNTIGAGNTAVGGSALFANTTGIQNTVVGSGAGSAVTAGSNNLFLGYGVGSATTTGSNNIYLDGNSLSPANESNTIRIGNTQTSAYIQGVYGVSVTSPQVAQINSGGQLGSVTTASLGTSSNAPSTLVARDSSGNFSTTMITLSGTTTNATDVATKAYVDSIAASPGTNLNTANTTVKRDGTGSFAAQTISLVDEVISGNISMSDSTNATVGNINKAGTRFIHNFGTNNTFVGKGSGNFTTTGTGNNTVIGAGSLTALTSGNQNTIIGSGSGTAITSGNANIIIGYLAGINTTIGNNNIYLDSSGGGSPANESNTIRIGNNQTQTCFIRGIRGTTTGQNNAVAVLIDSQGQLGTTSSSIRFKHNIQDMSDVSSALLDLRPVTFAYNSDPTESTQFGLIAEEVDTVFPELVARDEDGTPYTVRYEVLPVLLLNEMKKQQKEIEDQRGILESQAQAITKIKSEVTELKKMFSNR